VLFLALSRLTPYPHVRFLLSSRTLLLWLCVMTAAMLVALGNWVDIRSYAALHFLTPRFLALSWVIYPVMKALHELGHALMLRRFGCEVPEVGVNFMLFVPLPYVDASGANRLSSRLQRALISAAGIMVELSLAALGMTLWLTVEDGWVREAAFVVMSIGGLSTLIFNGNPLMKFDGYFVACDVLDLPNLAQRSARHNERVWQRLLAWLLRTPSDAHAHLEADPLERWALRLYTPLAWMWRLVVSAFMVSWAADKSSWLGMAILLWMLWSLVLQPCKQWVDNLVMTPGFDAVRGQASWVGTLAAAVVVVLLATVPLPAFIVADGVVWLPDDAQVRAASDGRVDAVLVLSGQRVHAGQALIQLKDEGLVARKAVLQAKIDASNSELNASLGVDALKVSNARQALQRDEAELGQVEHDLANLTLRAPRSGEFVLSREEDLDEREVSRGQLLAYVLSDARATVRVLVSQRDVDDVRSHLKGVSVMLAERPGTVWVGRPSGDTPAAVERLPAKALSNKFGGPVAADASDPDGLKPAEPMFVMDVKLTQPLPRSGGLAKVKLELEPRPLLQTWLMRWKQLFLRHFSDVGASG
jgi:putative peptide zinc metalloprotease protein